MKSLDLFSGIGGFALAGRWAGIETVQFVEIDPFCRRVLNKNFEGVPIHEDIRTFDARPFLGRIDFVCGGFPCQPYSIAGKRLGEADDRALWNEMYRVITECKPDWVLGENVANFVNMGLDACLFDLEKAGYTIRAFIVPACAVEAPHRRDRVWILAHSNCERELQSERGIPNFGKWFTYGSEDVANSTSKLRERGKQTRGREWQSEMPIRGEFRDLFSIEPTIRRSDDGLPKGLDIGKRIVALGNAIVPQVAYRFLKAIVEMGEVET